MTSIDIDHPPSEYISIYNKVASEIQDAFTDWVSTGICTERSLIWLTSTVASRNPLMSPLFKRCCAIAFALELSSNKHYSFQTKDPILAHSLNQYFKSQSIASRAHTPRYLRALLKIPINGFKRFLFSSYRLINRWLSRKPDTTLHTKKLNILEVFVFNKTSGSGIIDNGRYKDRYYDGLIDTLNQKRSNWLYMPSFMGYTKHKSIFLSIRNTVENMFVPDDFLQTADYARALLAPIARLFLPLDPKRFRGVSTRLLVYSELIEYGADYGSITGVLLNRLPKRLRDKGYHVDHWIGWYENQPIDKGLIQGVHEYSPNTKTYGYLGGISDPVWNPFLAPCTQELQSGCIAKCLWAMGEGFCSTLKRFSSDVRVEVAPAFRYENTLKIPLKEPDTKNMIVLVGTSIGALESAGILEFLANANIPESVRILVKPHPATPQSAILRHLTQNLPRHFEWIEGDFVSALLQAQLFIGSSSSTTVEAIAGGRPVALIQNPLVPTQNPIPQFVSKSLWRYCADSNALKQYIDTVAAYSDTEWRQLLAEVNAMRNLCFHTDRVNFIHSLLND